MTTYGASLHGVAASSAAEAAEISEADFSAALLRAQYRSLARLGPYVHGVVILAALGLFGPIASTNSLLETVLPPVALISVSVFRLVAWFRARAGVEDETLDTVRRRVRAASVLGPMLTLAFTLLTAISTWRDGAVEFALAVSAVWIVAVVCAICLNTLALEASIIVVAATAPLIAAFLARGSESTLWLAALIALAAGFVIRMLGEHSRMFAEIVRSRLVIAGQQRAAEEARQAAVAIALTDDLTRLPNRRCFKTLLAEQIRTGTETGEPFALALLDLDGFKPINDVHGHPVGDEILRQVADRLAKAIDGRGSAARIGGDEFAVLCDGVGARGEAIALGEDIQSIFATPFVVQRLSLRLTCACGFALFPSCGAKASELVRVADAALYRAKAIGGGGVTVSDAGAGDTAASGAALKEALRREGGEAEMGVRSQPIVDLTSGRTSGVESIARFDEAGLSWAAPAPIGIIDQASRGALRRAAMAGAR
jgi:diguanylate cyclase (GGDEF)-like protein